MRDVIDLRSDTVTRPTPGMRKAIAEAEVGDDAYGEDPTVNRLEEVAAGLMAREAALLVPSGVMANQIALRVYAEAGTEVVVEEDAHIVSYEDGAGALLAGVQIRTVPTTDGRLTAAVVADAIRPDAYALTPTSLVTVEQPHNRKGGAILPLEQLARIAEVVRAAGVRLYLDGARLFNAAVATGTPASDFAAHADGLMFSLSKGLGAPVGSVLVGDADAISDARLWRRRYGGSMRQAGIIAAAGLHAVDHHVDRLAEDHDNARLLGQTVAESLPWAVDPGQVETNMVYVDTGDLDAPAVVAGLAEDGVLVGAVSSSALRLVTHLDVDRGDCKRAADLLVAALSS
jgi:threonine aldolase